MAPRRTHKMRSLKQSSGGGGCRVRLKIQKCFVCMGSRCGKEREFLCGVRRREWQFFVCPLTCTRLKSPKTLENRWEESARRVEF
jgi:hypothetical protein